MSEPQTAAELMRAYYCALDLPDLDRLDTLFAGDVEWRFPGQELRGVVAVKQRMARSLAAGLRMEHRISRLVEQDGVAICELAATNIVGDRRFVVRGAVVCEAMDGRIVRLAAYPDAADLPPYLAALNEAVSTMRRG